MGDPHRLPDKIEQVIFFLKNLRNPEVFFIFMLCKTMIGIV